MLFGFIRQKTLAPRHKNTTSLDIMLDRTWDLSGAGMDRINGAEPGEIRAVTLIFNRLNRIMTGILKSVVALASLGPDLFRISGEFKSGARIQEEKIREIARAGERISGGIEEISGHTRELTHEFCEIESDVSSALKKGDHSMAGFKEISSHVSRLEEAIQVLKENSDSIGTIIDVINNISDETNILSLNARIEAARGQADGKGFKVIAEEVGNLAKQSKEATLDIRGRLSLLGEKISQTVDAVDRVAEQVRGCEQDIEGANTALNQVCARFGRLSRGLSEINEAAGSQATEVRQVSGHIREIESALKGQVKDADTIFSIAEQVNGRCDRMIVDTGVFHLAGHDRARQTAEAMASDTALVSGSAAGRELSLKNHLKQSPFVELAYITDQNGRQVTANIYSEALAGREDLEKGLGRNWADKEWFRQPSATGETFVSKVYRSSATRDFCFTVAVPLAEGGRFSGVLGIDVNFRDMLDI